MATRTLMILLEVVISSTAAGSQQSRAERIVAAYLKVPLSEDSRYGEARSQRVDTLSGLWATPDEAVDALERALPQVEDPRQRIELADELGRHIQTQKSAALLCKLLHDPNDKVRWQAIHSLRALAKRTDRVGGTRTQWHPDNRSPEEKERAARQAIRDHVPVPRRRTVAPKDERTEPRVEFAPKVEGLVPYLVEAANDDVEANRICTLYALADTRDPTAVAELRHRLKDPSEKVRLYAACFLTEYQDASGLTEMLSALERLRRTDPEQSPDYEFEYYGQVERLVASFERLTGKSFGAAPMHPGLSSNLHQVPQLKQRHKTLLDAWAQWWAWDPTANP
ncbi:MAG: HEAT repeat domain-containing protein [Sedimentisphaerales bacterium]|nr:HEAT repeat domain-containing protein [Sedimentisphaerales bacterium]